jgi:hypothetical protein
MIINDTKQLKISNKLMSYTACNNCGMRVWILFTFFQLPFKDINAPIESSVAMAITRNREYFHYVKDNSKNKKRKQLWKGDRNI